MSTPAGGLRVVRREADPRVVDVVLDRPEVRNAFDAALVAALGEAALFLAADASVRVVVLSGAGKSFCAGADLNWMRATAANGPAENRRDAVALARTFRAWDDLPRPVVGRIQGAALGGGTGLAAVCDIVVASGSALFGTTEVRLGIVPAVIGPYLVRKIGPSAARAWFLAGSRVEAAEALRAGLVHRVVPEASLDLEVEAVVADLLLGAPEAQASAKSLAKSFGTGSLDGEGAAAVEEIASRRASEEGQEGMAAFLEKRPPRWTIRT